MPLSFLAVLLLPYLVMDAASLPLLLFLLLASLLPLFVLPPLIVLSALLFNSRSGRCGQHLLRSIAGLP